MKRMIPSLELSEPIPRHEIVLLKAAESRCPEQPEGLTGASRRRVYVSRCDLSHITFGDFGPPS